MRTTFSRLLLWIALAAGLFAGPARAARLDPALEAILAQKPPEAVVPVLIVMREQGLNAAQRSALRRLPRQARRAEGLRMLDARAASTRTGLTPRLEALRAVGAAGRIRPLRVLNGIAAEVRADRMRDLLGEPGVDRVLWDPPIDPAQMLDRVADAGSAGPGPTTLSRLDPVIWWQLDAVSAPPCWALGYDGAGTVVAVLDTGIDYQHPDLAGHVYSNPNEIPANELDDDNNGFVDDVRGWDFVEGDNDATGFGVNDHGTLVAGIVLGDGTSGTRTGVAPGATVLPIRVVGGPWSTIIEGIDYAILMGVDVIQMSVSQKWRFFPKPDYAAWRAVADNELALGLLHANSIGNEGDNQDTDPIPFNIAAPGGCPAPWRHPDQYLAGGASGITGVGAIAQNGVAADYSSRGPVAWEDIAAFNPQYPYAMPPEYRDYPWSAGLGGLTKPDLCAPGPNTLSTALGGGYAAFDGTSAATPHVAGAMAILLQADSTLTPEEVEMMLETTADDLGERGRDNVYGAGRLNVHAALVRTLDRALFGPIRGCVRDAVTDSLVRGASVLLAPPDTLRTDSHGEYRAPFLAGAVSVSVDAFGYYPDTSVASVVPGNTATVHDRWLLPRPTGSVRGTVRDSRGPLLRNVRLAFSGTPLPPVWSDSAGVFLLADVPAEVPLTLEAVRFGHHSVLQAVELTPGQADTLDLVMAPGVYDDGELDQGWAHGLDDTAQVGRWERGDPTGTWFSGTPVQPEDDADQNGTRCFLTMNCNPGAGPGFSDVDGGTTTLVSPVFDLSSYPSPRLVYKRWFSNHTGGPADDHFLSQVSADSGGTWVTLETLADSDAYWTQRSYDLALSLPITAAMRIRFVASDLGSPSNVEAAVDQIEVIPSPTDAVSEPGSAAAGGPVFRLDRAFPNPFSRGTALRFALPAGGPVRLAVYDVGGRRVRDLVNAPLPAGEHATSWDGRDGEGRRCASGVYLYRLEQGERRDEGRLVLIR